MGDAVGTDRMGGGDGCQRNNKGRKEGRKEGSVTKRRKEGGMVRRKVERKEGRLESK